MDQAIWLLRSAYAAVGCALRSAHPNAEEVSSLCSAHAAVGCVLPSSHPNADDFRCSAVRTPLWVAYCVCCFRMRKNFVSLHHFVALRCARRCGLRIAALHPNAGECRCSASRQLFLRYFNMSPSKAESTCCSHTAHNNRDAAAEVDTCQ